MLKHAAVGTTLLLCSSVLVRMCFILFMPLLEGTGRGKVADGPNTLFATVLS